MDSSLDGAAGDSSKCNEMSVDEKRQLVYELSKQSHLASEVLQAWSRQEILQILCAEMGKERKYTGLTKVKIIETLLKIVSEKNSGENEGKKRDSDCLPIQRNTKRQRKVDNPSRYVIPASNNVTSNNASGSCNSVNTKGESTIYCKNLACRAVLRQEDSFCRRCSCCICRKYDDNKDPSLWLTCSSDPPFEDESCGFSCHLECAFKTEKSGLGKDKQSEGCCFYCVSCATTPPDVAALPSSRSSKMQQDTATTGSTKIRFVVSGLAPASEYCFKVVSYSGTREMGVDEINVLTRSAEEGVNCSSGVERSESPLTNCSTLSSNPSSVEAESNNDYIVPKKPLKNDDNNSPSVDESAAKRAKRTTESDIVQIENNVEQIVLLDEEEQEAVLDKNGSGSGSETPALVTTKNLASNRNNSDASLPITPFRSDEIKNRQARIEKSVKDNCNNGDHSANGGTESGLEHCVKIIRQLECSGHIDKNFRQKFLTWYSLRATSQEIRVVKIFIDTFIDDPMALAEQLIDTFEDRVSIKRSAIGGSGASAVVPSGFCMKLWH
ncbi:unnamed protein product [Arabidopsis arenosa]|uniref:Fibronectin type-III domain-containing protein n=1 Tax=Arabidopsis arenosa TaxID=38785 RepID=A0A8S2AQR7_ARAAE|nr:unnamed protein product [Arabidopsis arenosa]